jgi:hypothetical protein
VIHSRSNSSYNAKSHTVLQLHKSHAKNPKTKRGQKQREAQTQREFQLLPTSLARCAQLPRPLRW